MDSMLIDIDYPMSWDEALCYCAANPGKCVRDKDNVPHWVELGIDGGPQLKRGDNVPPFGQLTEPYRKE